MNALLSHPTAGQKPQKKEKTKQTPYPPIHPHLFRPGNIIRFDHVTLTWFARGLWIVCHVTCCGAEKKFFFFHCLKIGRLGFTVLRSTPESREPVDASSL